MMNLNEDQIKAIKHESGPLLIVAGAGTGKTAVITERIKYLIQKRKVQPENILALTFTEKAAAEMLERLDVVMPLGYEEPWLSTFHAFGDRILRQEGLEIGLSPDYTILSQPEQWLLVKKNLFKLGLNYYRPLGNPTKFIGALLKVFSRLQDEDESPEEFLTYVKNSSGNDKLVMSNIKLNPKIRNKKIRNTKYEIRNTKTNDELQRLEELAEAYSYYQQLKLQENLLDFGDLIAWTLRLFRERPSVLKKYQQQFRHILVDEFQDTNFSQLQLIKALAPADKDPNLVVVGDDFQSIYKWRGAAISNILDFKKHYPRTKTIILNENYRSTQPLLDVSYAMIKNNEPETLEVKLGIDKSMRTQRKEKIIPQIFVLPNLEAEADFVAGKIMELAAKQSYTYKDFAILARANNHLDVFVAALKRYGIPYQLLGNRGLFDQDEVRTLIFFLKVIVDPTDTPSLFQLLHAEVFQVKPDLLLEMLRLSKNERKTLWQIVQESSRAHEGLQLLVKEVAQARQRAIKESAAPILFDFVQQTGYVTQFLKDETLENQLKLKNLNLFFNLLKRFESEHQEDTLVDGVEYLDLLIEAGENPAQAEIEDIDTVNLLTVHSAKGLEFPVVFVANLVADRFPTRNRGDQIKIPDNLIKESLPSGDYHLQEERRLFYVACTRAKDYLFITAAKDYGGAREKRLSGFVKELGVKIEEEKAAEDKQLSWLEVPPEAIIKPRRIIDGKLRLDFISYSQIETFNTCPLKYKYRYILQVPAKPHHALTFGQSIHYTLRDFHRFEQKGQTPNLETLLYLYEKHFLPLGYDSLEHREARFEAGKKALTSYFKVYKDQFKGKPYLLEQKFRVNLAGVWLIGKIDRIDKLNQYKFELIDYKTGELKEQNKVDKDAQLTIYKMAAQTALRIDVGNLALYFIEANKKLLTRRTNEQLEEKKEEIIKTIEKMRQSKFEATPAYPFPCSWCEYNRICPFAKKA